MFLFSHSARDLLFLKSGNSLSKRQWYADDKNGKVRDKVVETRQPERPCREWQSSLAYCRLACPLRHTEGKSEVNISSEPGRKDGSRRVGYIKSNMFRRLVLWREIDEPYRQTTAPGAPAVPGVAVYDVISVQSFALSFNNPFNSPLLARNCVPAFLAVAVFCGLFEVCLGASAVVCCEWVTSSVFSFEELLELVIIV